MSTAGTMATGFTLTLNTEEREQLLAILEQTLLDKQVEAHRTDALEYKEHVEHQEKLLQGLLKKLRRS